MNSKHVSHLFQVIVLMNLSMYLFTGQLMKEASLKAESSPKILESNTQCYWNKNRSPGFAQSRKYSDMILKAVVE